MISYVVRSFMMPSWWMPPLCAKAFAPRWPCRWTTMPGQLADQPARAVQLPRVDGSVQGVVEGVARIFMPMTTSSSEQLPARSPRPVDRAFHARAPCGTAASEFATASPRSLWQCTWMTARPMFGTCSTRYAISRRIRSARHSHRVRDVHRRGSGVDHGFDDLGQEVRLRARGVSGLNCTSRQNFLAYFTAQIACLTISCLAFFSLNCRWMADVARNTWIQLRFPPGHASPQR